MGNFQIKITNRVVPHRSATILSITTILIVLCTIALVPCLSKAIPIFVSVAGKIDGTLSYVNISVNKTTRLVKLTSVWENTGSAGCKVLMRADVENEKGIVVYTSWSVLKRVPPGGVATLKNYWYYDDLRGNYSVRLRLYFCDEIKDYGKINVTLPSSETKGHRPIKIKAISYVPEKNTSAIFVRIEFPSNLSKKKLNGVILPLRVMLGDKIYTVVLHKVDIKKDGTKIIIPWDYGILVTKKIPMVLVDTKNGKAYEFVVVTRIRRSESLFDKVVVLVSRFKLWVTTGVFGVVLLFVIRTIKYKKIEQQSIQRKKENMRKKEQKGT